MTKKTKEELALEEYLAGLSEKKVRCSDNRILAMQERSKPGSEWHRKTAEKNRHNATNAAINEKIRQKNKGKRVTFLNEESRKKLAKSGYQPMSTPFGYFESRNAAAEYLTINKLTTCNLVNSVRVWLSTRLKNDPSNYYYISKEEYTKLTGKDPYNE